MEGPETDRSLDSNPRFGFALVIAFGLVGVGLIAGLATDTIDMLLASFVALLALILFGILLVVRREGIRTAENRLLVICVVTAMALLFLLSEFSTIPSEGIFAIVFFVGVLLPHLLLEYTDVKNVM